ncbi:MAG: class I SAM-dependent methyltransferase [Actinomycetota bacterium]
MKSFGESMRVRSADNHADFLLPLLRKDFLVLDVGCGEGTITVVMAERARHVVGVDPSSERFEDAREYASRHRIENVEFRPGSVYALDFPSDQFDACLCHSVLETLDRPLDGLAEMRRTLKAGVVLGVACVEYGVVRVGAGG